MTIPIINDVREQQVNATVEALSQNYLKVANISGNVMILVAVLRANLSLAQGTQDPVVGAALSRGFDSFDKAVAELAKACQDTLAVQNRLVAKALNVPSV